MRGALNRIRALFAPVAQTNADTGAETIADLRKKVAERDTLLAAAWEHAHKLDAALQRLDGLFRSASYNADSLTVFNKNIGFMRDPKFLSAYRRGADSGHKLGRSQGVEGDIHIEWRVHVACWAAARAARLQGSLVECGVNTGNLSLAVCEYIDINALDKDFYLFDTFRGIPAEQMRDDERDARTRENAEVYEECYDLVRRNFAPFPRAHLVRGLVPDTLATVPIDRVCYLSIDMNIVEPEVAALNYFWDKLVSGAVVILDDYGWAGYHLQQEAHDRFAAACGVPILLLPTGQGVLIKP